MYLSLDNSNPATLWLGTTWEKIEEKFLLGSSVDYPLGFTGGNSSIILTEANIPRHRHQVDSTTATIPAHIHSITLPRRAGDSYNSGTGWGADNLVSSNDTINTSSAGGGSTGAIAPYTSYIGSGTAFNNMPPYIAVNIWKRLS